MISRDRRVAHGRSRYLLKDHLGSLDVVTDATGAVLERLSFDAFLFAPCDTRSARRPQGAQMGKRRKPA